MKGVANNPVIRAQLGLLKRELAALKTVYDKAREKYGRAKAELKDAKMRFANKGMMINELERQIKDLREENGALKEAWEAAEARYMIKVRENAELNGAVDAGIKDYNTLLDEKNGVSSDCSL